MPRDTLAFVTTLSPDRFFSPEHDLCCVVALDGGVLATTPAWRRALGWDEAALSGRLFLDLVHEDDRAALLAAARGASTEAGPVRFACRFRRGDGGFARLDWRALAPAADGLLHAVVTPSAPPPADDGALDTARGEILTLLNGVVGLAAVLENGLADERSRRMAAALRESGVALKAACDDLVDLALATSGGLALAADAFDPAVPFGRVAAQLAARAKAKGVSVLASVAAAPGALRLGDAERFERVVEAALAAAVAEASAASLVLTLTAERDGAVAIEAAGPGLDAGSLAQAFGLPAGGEAGETRRGAGFAPLFARRVAEAMGGAVTIEALRPGARLRLKLPMPAAAAGADAAAESDQPLRGLNVLAVDDNDANRFLLEEVLRSFGARATVAADGCACLSLADRCPYDIVLLDIAMPGMDGVETLGRLRAAEAAAGRPLAPALAVTANVMPHQVRRYLAAGFAGHVAKPFGPDALCAAIRRTVADRPAQAGPNRLSSV